jgi:signal transduction histidine kinase
MKRIPSLGRKITLGYLGYYTLAVLVGGLALFTYGEMSYIEHKVRAGERVTEFFDTTLEIRRFEKNYFLYRQKSDLDEALRNVDAARQTFSRHRDDFAPLAPPDVLQQLETGLEKYRTILTGLPLADGTAPLLEEHLRESGKKLVDAAETLAKTERRLLQQALDRSRFIFLVSVAGLGTLMVGLGFILSRMVVRPLKHMENCVAALAEGHREKLHIDSEDSEIVSISNAFNHMLDELELRQRSLLRAEKLASMGTMLSGVAHELNNPLSNISTSCQILDEEFDHGDREHQKELIAQIDEQTHRAGQIVRTLLDFTRDREVRKERFLLRPLAEETLRLLHCQTRPGADIRLEIPDGLMVTGERQRLQQALLNLVKNALEATEGEGGVTVRAREIEEADALRARDNDLVIFNKCPAGRPAVEIQVADQGPGIPAEVLVRVFDPFFTTKDVGLGSGLGLFVVHQIIEEHGGCIRLNSTPSQGTEITLLLPLGTS